MLDQVQELLGGAASQCVALVRFGQRGAVGRQRDAQHFHNAVHTVGGEHAAARSARRAAEVFQHLQLCLVDLPGLVRADPLKHADQVNHATVGRPACGHWPPADENSGHIQPHGRHQHAGDDLVAVGDADHAVEGVGGHHRLDAVGDQLAAGQGELHALVPHRDAVVHADGVELERHAAGGADRVLHQLAEALQVHVAGHDVHVGIHDCDERLVHVFVTHAGRLEQRAVRRALDAALDTVRAISHEFVRSSSQV